MGVMRKWQTVREPGAGSSGWTGWGWGGDWSCTLGPVFWDRRGGVPVRWIAVTGTLRYLKWKT